MLNKDELNKYDKWLETTPAVVLASATALGGWSNVFPPEMPVWASRVRNYFNVLPTTFQRLPDHAAQSALGSKTGPRMTFLANCHQDQTFNRYKRGKPTPLGPAPDPFKVHAACPAKAPHEVVHMDDFIPTRDALSGDVYLDDHGWMWYQMSPGATIYHWGDDVRFKKSEAAYTQISGQENVPVFKLISMDGSGGSREVILFNYYGGGPSGGSANIGKTGAVEDIYKRISRHPIKQGSYNYAEATQLGFKEHDLRDVKTHLAKTEFYVNPINMHADLKLRKFPPKDKQGSLLATQVKWT